jgi:antitoxin (DNA-binding transcriptional repressor) of toxin-antitoxin stability system
MVMMGEDVHITKNGKPVAKLVAENAEKRELGQCAGMLKISGALKDPSDDFSALSITSAVNYYFEGLAN